MSRYARGLFIAMEDGETMEDTVAVDGGELESAMADIESDGRDLEDGMDLTESSMEDLDTLEDIQGVMQDSVDSGEGLDEDAAEIAQIAVESIYKRLGIRKGHSMPSLESFGSTNTRLHATKIAMESVGDMIQDIFRKIVDWLEMIGNKIVEFFKKVINGVGSLKKSIVNLKKKLSDKKDKKLTKDSTFEDDGIARTFYSVRGDALLHDYVNSIIINSTEFLEAANTSIDSYQTFITLATTVLRTKKFSTSEHNNAVDAIYKDTVIDLAERLFSNMSKGTWDKKSLAHGRSYKVIIEGSKDSSSTAPLTIRLETIEENKDYNKLITIPAINQINEIVDKAENLINKIDEICGKPNKIKEATNKIESVLKKAASGTSDDDVGKQYLNRWKALSTTITRIGMLSQSMVSKSVSNAVTVANSSIKYCNKCLDYYS